MATGHLSIDLAALCENWRALNKLCDGKAAAVVKANGYGLGSGRVSKALAEAGVTEFFVAAAQEATAIRASLGPIPVINVFSGHMEGDTGIIADLNLTPLLNSPEQISRHKSQLPNHPYGLQIDTGMNRLGVEEYDFDLEMAHGATLIMSHLACADDPTHEANTAQLSKFIDMTAGTDARKSLAATGGVLLGSEFHFDLTRPGIGLYGGAPFDAGAPVVSLDLPVIQTRILQPGEAVGYGCSWIAQSVSKIATVAAGYADGLIRSLSNSATLYAGDVACPLVGRVSMDLLTIDVTHLKETPASLSILNVHQTIDDLAEAAGTIGYEILTSLGGRYTRDTE